MANPFSTRFRLVAAPLAALAFMGVAPVAAHATVAISDTQVSESTPAATFVVSPAGRCTPSAATSACASS